MKWLFYTSMILLQIFVVAIFAITPYITRKTESFGIAIPQDVYYNPTLVQFRKQYARYCVLFGGLITLVLAGLIPFLNENSWTIAYTISIFGYSMGSFFIYYHFHKKMRILKQEANWYKERKESIVIDTKFYNEKLVYSNGWFLIPFAVSLFSLVFTFMNSDRFPDPLPMQYDLAGNVTRWADKSIGSLLAVPLLQLFLTGLFLFINIVISKSKQQLDPDRPEESRLQNIIFRRRWSLFTIVSGTIMVAMFSLIQLSYVFPLNNYVLFISFMFVTLLIIAGAFVLTLTTGQGGSRVQVVNGKSGKKINRDDDRYWKLGMFYFNPDDPALFVEKRFGSGWTNNFARPLSWVLLLVPILIVILITIFI